jgi:hypothetical protein
MVLPVPLNPVPYIKLPMFNVLAAVALNASKPEPITIFREPPVRLEPAELPRRTLSLPPLLVPALYPT